MSTASADAVAALRDTLANTVKKVVEFRDEHTVIVNRVDLRALLQHCYDELDFDYLLDISSVDNLGSEPRFEIVYELYSFATKAHLRIKAAVSEDETVDTVSDIWPTADWHEREVYDMMGIKFADHPDLRRILMWEGFPYFPLRKDFPLAGKHSEMPDVAFSDAAPLAGGPFVTSPTSADTVKREPRAKQFSQD